MVITDPLAEEMHQPQFACDPCATGDGVNAGTVFGGQLVANSEKDGLNCLNSLKIRNFKIS